MRSPVSVLKKQHREQTALHLHPTQGAGSYGSIAGLNTLNRKQVIELQKLRENLRKNRKKKAKAEISDALFHSIHQYTTLPNSIPTSKREWVARLPLLKRKTKVRVAESVRSLEALRLRTARTGRTLLSSVGVKPKIQKKVKRTMPL